MKTVKYALTFVVTTMVMLAGLCGCATPEHLPEYSSTAAVAAPGAGAAKTAESEGAIVSVEPFADKARCETYFALNAPAAGIAILHVQVQNRSGYATWLLRKANCKLLLAGQDSTLGGANTEQSRASGEAMAITGAALMGLATTPVLIALGSHQVKHATTVQRNFTEKELRDKTISPGQAEEGFLYYQMPKKGAPFKGALQVSFINTGNQQTNSLQIPIDYEIK